MLKAARPGWLLARISRLSQGLRPLLGHVRLRHVTTPATVTPHHLLKARTAKTELYTAVADLYAHHEELVRYGRWPALAPIMQQTLLLPTVETPAAAAVLRLTATAFLAQI